MDSQWCIGLFVCMLACKIKTSYMKRLGICVVVMHVLLRGKPKCDAPRRLHVHKNCDCIKLAGSWCEYIRQMNVPTELSSKYLNFQVPECGPHWRITGRSMKIRQSDITMCFGMKNWQHNRLSVTAPGYVAHMRNFRKGAYQYFCQEKWW
jgi:hypothetical protein